MNSQLEILEIKQLIARLLTDINLLIPKKMSVGYISEVTNMSRQAIHKSLINNFEEDKDFWKEGKKIYVTKDTGLYFLHKANNTKLAA